MNNMSILRLEKKSLFFINSFLILLVIFSFLAKISTIYFFYINIFLTFVLSYYYFKKSRKLAKYTIITNMFILFYFYYPYISSILYELLGEESYVFILLYNILIAYLFLLFSGYKDKVLGNMKKINIKMIFLVILIGLTYGVFFFLLKEPVPIYSLFNPQTTYYFAKITFFTLILAISEQMIFSGFLFNIYSQLTNKKEAILQVSLIFGLFHFLRFENLLISYINIFDIHYFLPIIGYYVFLYLFMTTALYLYSFKTKKYEGNFIYPVLLHFITDLTLFFLVKYLGGY